MAEEYNTISVRLFVMNDINLAHFHGGKGCLVAFRGDTGTAGSVHGDGNLRKLCFQDQGVGYHADICAQAYQFNLIKMPLVPVRPAKGGLVDTDSAIYHQTVGDLPAIGSLDAVLYRQLFALRGIQIIFPVGVPGENDLISVFLIFFYFGGNIRDDGLCLFCSQRAVDEIFLHINHDQCLHRKSLPFIFTDTIHDFS